LLILASTYPYLCRKEDTKAIIGPQGVQEILSALVSRGLGQVSTVCIGGINSSNIARVYHQSNTPKKKLDGIALVSAIMASEDPEAAAKNLAQYKQVAFEYDKQTTSQTVTSVHETLQKIPNILQKLERTTPLCHNMTNLVVQNIAANVALAVGASPIMSNNSAEAPDLALLGGSLVVNMGTVTSETLAHYIKALQAYNAAKGPVLLDPVGAGATQSRRSAVKQLMAAGYFDVIKGNEGEIKTVGGVHGNQQRGVDSGASTLSLAERAKLVKDIAVREKNVVLMTGTTDVLSNGIHTYAISNGHPYLGGITGSGCTLGTTIASFLAVERNDKLLAALAGILMFEIAAERAAALDTVKGPGTFVPAFLDELNAIKVETASGNAKWLGAAKVQKFDIP
jgi:thiamine-phosphate diphosphorylase / hydroxyethylthiazole kinase